MTNKSIDVECSTITKIEYLPGVNVLIVILKNGYQYQFSSVGLDDFNRFYTSKDKFSFMKTKLIGNFPFRRIK
jgi:hypothetical protein